jgi:hypothetical protein
VPLTLNRVADKLLAFGPLGFWVALILGHGGHLSSIPLTIGGVVGSLGVLLKLILKLTHYRTKQEAL